MVIRATENHCHLNDQLRSSPPDYAAAHSHSIVPAVTLGDIQAGIEIAREQDAAKAAEIEAWLELVAGTWNVLAADGRVFRARARLMHGRDDRLIKDALIAATAQVHGLTVVTRNVRDFRPFGVTVLDPFAAG